MIALMIALIVRAIAPWGGYYFFISQTTFSFHKPLFFEHDGCTQWIQALGIEEFQNLRIEGQDPLG
jgi:hypothetical protein